MKRERVRTKHGFKGLGKFFLGCFVGFIITILAIAGLGYWAYTSLTVRRVEKLIKSDISNNKGVEKLTIQKAISIVKGISQNNQDGYTLAKLEEDFNIVIFDETNAPFGIDLSIIKNSPIKNLSNAVNETIDTITFNNVLKFLSVNNTDLGILNSVLEKTTTYYIYNGKLYTDAEHSIEVGFKYTIEGDVVKFANGAHTITSYTINPRFMDLPLNIAITKFSSNIKSLKIYKILNYKYNEITGKYYENCVDGEYTGEVSGVINAIAGYSIDELSNQVKINELKICDILGYHYNADDQTYYTSSTFEANTKVAGVMNALAGKTLGDLSKQQIIEDLYIYQVMGYYKKADDTYYTASDFSENSKVEGIMASIAGKKISQLDDDGSFNDILVADALGYKIKDGKVYESNGTTEVTGVVKHLVLMNSTISTIARDVKTLGIDQILDVTPEDENNSSIINALCKKNATIDNLDSKIKEITLGEMLGAKPKGDADNSSIVNALYDSTIGSLNDDINDLTLGSALGKTYEESTGVLKTFYGTKISELAGAIKDIKIWQAMGYFEKDGKYYTDADYESPVTGIMATLAGKKVSELSDSSSFNDLYVYEIKGYEQVEVDGTYKYYENVNGVKTKVNGVMSMVAGSKLSELSSVIEKIINEKSINELIDNGVIVITLKDSTKAVIGDFTIQGLVEFIDNNIE